MAQKKSHTSHMYGGQASPNSTYKQDINNVEGNIVAKISKKIPFDKDFANVIYNSNVSGTRLFSYFNYFLKEGETIIVHTNIPNQNLQYSIVGSSEQFPNSNSFLLDTTWLNDTYYTFTATEDMYLGVSIRKEDNTGITILNINDVWINFYLVKQTVTFPLQQGQKMYLNSYLAEDGIHHKRKQVTVNGNSITLTDAKTNGAYLCDQKVAGNLVGQTLTFDTAVTDAILEYELSEEIIEPYTTEQQIAYDKLQNLRQYGDITYIEFNQDVTFSLELEKERTDIKDRITDLEEKNALLLADHPTITGTGTEFSLSGTGDLPMEVLLGGNSVQALNYITYKCDGTETGDYYFVYDSINYQFTMPTVANGDILVFNTDTLVLTLDDTEIATTTDNTGTLLTFIASPNPEYKQDINNVEGDVVSKVQNKNWFNLNRTKGDPSDTTFQNTTKRIFNLKEFVVGIAASNYFVPSNVSSYSIKENSIMLNLSINSGYGIGFAYELPYGNYKLSCIKDNNGLIRAGYYKKDGTHIRGVSLELVNSIITISEEQPVVVIIFTGSVKNTDIVFSNIQLEPDIETLYVPHKEQTVTFPLQQGQKMYLNSYLADDGIHHKRKQVVFDGSEAGWIRQVFGELYRYKIDIEDSKVFDTNDASPAVCSHFHYDISVFNSNTITIGQFGQFRSSNEFYFATDKSTLEEWKAFLAEQYANGTPVILEYELSEEAQKTAIEPYTTEQQLAYNKLKEMQSYYDITNISGSSDNAKPIITANALMSIKALNSKIDNIENRLSLLEE